MIYSVHGTLIAKGEALAVVECGGVGYGCQVTLRTLASLGNIGETVFLYTDLEVREDGVELYGFMDQAERQCFQLLLTVSGVGPKAALSILSEMSPDQFTLAISAADYKTFTKVKGIGTKTAQRIVLDLKDKLGRAMSSVSSDLDANFSSVSASMTEGNLGEAIEALEALGYSREEVAPVLSKLDQTLSTSELVRKTLQEFGKNRS